MSSVAASRTSPQPREGGGAWRERSTQLFEELRGPAEAMVRRAFGSAFDDDTVEDVYASAWLATLRALDGREDELTEDEIRRYLLTAVARHAGKEMRRRKRRPVAALENAEVIGNGEALPEERAEDRERSRITRDLLASLPRRRRAVLMLRYGWGLEPGQVCDLIDGLSPRAYRKEITRGIDQLTERLRRFESGAWCADREPVLKAFAAGVADEEQRRQAEHHLAHCRHCADFVGKLSGHLHDLGSAVALPGAFDLAADGRISIPDRLTDFEERVRESVGSLVGRAGSEAPEAASSLPAAAPRGAGAAGAGVLAKLTGLGLAGKAAVACVGGGAIAAVCVAGGVGPIDLGRDSGARTAAGRGHERVAPATAFDVLPSARAEEEPQGEEHSEEPPPEEPPPPPPEEPPPPAPEPPPIDAPAPVDQFGEIPAGGSSSGGGGATSQGQAAAAEFGP